MRFSEEKNMAKERGFQLEPELFEYLRSLYIKISRSYTHEGTTGKVAVPGQPLENYISKSASLIQFSGFIEKFYQE